MIATNAVSTWVLRCHSVDEATLLSRQVTEIQYAGRQRRAGCRVAIRDGVDGRPHVSELVGVQEHSFREPQKVGNLGHRTRVPVMECNDQWE